jgi:lipopolysaccharide heptosyltransferase II
MPAMSKKVLFRFPNWLGDCIMAAPMLEAVKEIHPDWQIDIMVRGGLSELYKYDPGVTDVIRIDDKSGKFRRGQYFSVASEIGSKSYDSGIILPESFSSAFMFLMAGIPERIGYPGDLRKIMLSDQRVLPVKKVHRSIKYLNLILPDYAVRENFPILKVFTNPDSGQAADKLIGEIGRYVLIAPQSRALSRRWGYENYSNLAARISKELNLKVVFIGAADERDIIDQVGRRSGVEYLNLAGESTLLTSVEIMKRSEAYIGNDSGGAHLAAASGTYVISISGADDPDETRPLALRGKIIRKPLPCSPCVKNICPRDDIPNECMSVISVGEVFNAVCEAVNGN